MRRGEHAAAKRWRDKTVSGGRHQRLSCMRACSLGQLSPTELAAEGGKPNRNRSRVWSSSERPADESRCWAMKVRKVGASFRATPNAFIFSFQAPGRRQGTAAATALVRKQISAPCNQGRRIWFFRLPNFISSSIGIGQSGTEYRTYVLLLCTE